MCIIHVQVDDLIFFVSILKVTDMSMYEYVNV